MYQLFYKIEKVKKRAPSKISVEEEYEMAGEVEAATRTEAVRKWYQGDVNAFDDAIRSPEVGDVVMDPVGSYFILTPQGLWAAVSVS